MQRKRKLNQYPVSEHMSLHTLKKECEEADLLLKEGNTLVFGRGDPDADILFIGEAPGEKEDEQGEPFVGRAGKVLQNGIDHVSIDSYYIANILKYRPPNNRDPKTAEIKNHTPYLIKQIEHISPNVIATLGNYSTKFVLNGFEADGMDSVQGISSLHGKKKHVELNGKTYTIIPLYHPAATLYNPNLRPDFEEDLRKVREESTQSTLI